MRRTSRRRTFLAMALALASCDSTEGGTADCREASRACAPGFSCVETGGGAWACQPGDGGASGSADGETGGRDAQLTDGSSGDVEPNASTPDIGPPRADTAVGLCEPNDEAPCGTDQGLCRAGTQHCDDTGNWGRCFGAIGPVRETCDGQDNDCDGDVDEGDPDGGSFCSTGELGFCAAGLLHCIDGEITCVRHEEPADADETCNGLDDDCDGDVDEDWAPMNTCGIGACSRPEVCAQGHVVCRAGVPSTEVCNEIDDDCDGRVDEDAQVETCNGRDDDCDGRIDEDDPGGGLACDTGELGRCALGTSHCIAGGLQCVRNAAPAALDATCDATDDDCDGQIDEEWAPDRSCGLGACERSEVCENGAVVCSPGEPVAETCNGDDDDCNGLVDDGIVPIATHCGRGACLRQGEVTCANGVPRDTCEPGAPTDEACDGVVDDDCDGQVDDGCLCVNGIARPCGSDIGLCGLGVESCVAGRWGACEGGVRPQQEICDGADDDCNEVEDDVVPLIRGPRWFPEAVQPGDRAEQPAIAVSNREFGVVWVDWRRVQDGELQRRLAFRRIGRDGRAISENVLDFVTRWGAKAPSIVWNGSEYGVSWLGRREPDGQHRVFFARLSLDGALLGNVVEAGPATEGSLRTSIAWTGESYGLVWDHEGTGTVQTYFVRISGDGQRPANVVRVSQSEARSMWPSLDWSGDSFGVVWVDNSRELHGNHVCYTGLDLDGSPVTDETQLLATDALPRRPGIRWNGRAFGIVWTVGTPTFALVSADGVRLSENAELSLSTTVETSLAWAGTHFAVPTLGTIDGERTLRVLRVSADGIPLGDGTDVSVAIEGDRILEPLAFAWSGTQFGVAWAAAVPERRIVFATGPMGCPPAAP